MAKKKQKEEEAFRPADPASRRSEDINEIMKGLYSVLIPINDKTQFGAANEAIKTGLTTAWEDGWNAATDAP